MSVKRWTWDDIEADMPRDATMVDASSYSSLLAVLRQCVEAMDHWDDWTGWAPEEAKAALAAARAVMEEEKP